MEDIMLYFQPHVNKKDKIYQKCNIFVTLLQIWDFITYNQAYTIDLEYN